jgi:hypothetical protein
MAIHHSQIKKAEKAGYTLTEEDDAVVAFWPKRALRIHGSSASDAMAQMQAAMVLADNDYNVSPYPAEPRLVMVGNEDGQVLVGCPMPPVAAHKAIWLNKNAEWRDDADATQPATIEEQVPIANPVERINGIAIDGAIAHSEGTPAGDCPYSSEDEEDDEYEHFIRWNEEWDAAADEADAEENKLGGSVVSDKYRARYAEMGHPTHCGDWLAETLNELCRNKGGTNLDLFEDICGMNGVDMSKYSRSSKGWEGRFRMTGRNLLAKRVYTAGGVLKIPLMGDTSELRAPAEWMATQRFKMPKADQAAPIPTPAESE